MIGIDFVGTKVPIILNAAHTVFHESYPKFQQSVLRLLPFVISQKAISSSARIRVSKEVIVRTLSLSLRLWSERVTPRAQFLAVIQLIGTDPQLFTKAASAW